MLSKVCRRELLHAVKHNKRIIPVLRREGFKEQKLHAVLSRYNWLYFRARDEFESSFQLLIATVNINLDYIESHTGFTVKASEWDRENRDSTYLLRGSFLTEAELWIERSADKTPQPTDLQRAYILASQSAETARLVYRNSVTYLSNFIKILTSIRVSRRYLWAKPIEWLLFIVVIVSSLLKLLDYSYIPFRDSYLSLLPQATSWYGERFKGIEPEVTTLEYLALVDELEAQDGLDTPTSQAILAQLREESISLVDENPFQFADKPGHLIRISNLMRDRLSTDSAKNAFRQFWSTDYLSQSGEFTAAELAFFNNKIRPVMDANYFRSINRNGNPVELYWYIDSIVFGGIFGLELTLRLVSLRLKSKMGIKRALAMRWYDFGLLLPIVLGQAAYFFVYCPCACSRVSLGIVGQHLDC